MFVDDDEEEEEIKAKTIDDDYGEEGDEKVNLC